MSAEKEEKKKKKEIQVTNSFVILINNLHIFYNAMKKSSVELALCETLARIISHDYRDCNNKM